VSILNKRAVCTIASIVVIVALAGCKQVEEKKKMTGFTVVISSTDYEVQTRISFEGEKQLESLLLSPLARGTIIADAEWVILGDVKIVHPNGELETLTLFRPLGKVRWRGKTFDVDLSALFNKLRNINQENAALIR